MQLLGFRVGVLAILLMVVAPVQRAAAHCDTMDGPVVAAARQALQTGEVTPVLKWVKKDSEAEIRAAFARAMKVRAQGAEARELADLYFFETLVRVHRAGEGAAYNGLKPAGAELESGIAEADQALDSGSVEKLVRTVNANIAAGLRRRFARVRETRKHADASVAAGREYVEAYVEFIHYVERLHAEAGSAGSARREVGQFATAN